MTSGGIFLTHAVGTASSGRIKLQQRVVSLASLLQPRSIGEANAASNWTYNKIYIWPAYNCSDCNRSAGFTLFTILVRGRLR